MVDHGRPWSTTVDHGRPWSTMVDRLRSHFGSSHFGSSHFGSSYLGSSSLARNFVTRSVCALHTPGPDAFHQHDPTMAPTRATAEWYCSKCWGKGNERYRNNGSRTECRKYNTRKGDCHWGPVKPPGQAAGGGNDAAKKLQDAEARNRKQQEEINKLKAAVESSDTGGSVGGDDAGTAAMDKTISQLRAMVQPIKAMGAGAPAGWLADAEARLAAAILAKEEARPPSDRLASARNAQVKTKRPTTRLRYL